MPSIPSTRRAPNLPWLLLALLACLAWRAGAQTVPTLHVAPDGDDRWSGTLPRPNADRSDGPLGSLAGARDAVRALRQLPAGRGPVRVLIAGGEYRLQGPVDFSPEDSGSPEGPAVYEAVAGERPVFTGGRRITGWRMEPGVLWRAHLSEVAEGDWAFEQLWVNGRRAVRARSPNAFYYHTAGPAGPGLFPEVQAVPHRAFLATKESAAELLQVPADRRADVVVVVYHAWEVSFHRLNRIHPEAPALLLDGRSPWPFMQWAPHQRYHVENFRGALDAPGEWFLDRDGSLLYRPLPGETPEEAEVIAPVVEQFLRLRGDPEKGRWVEHLVFRGLAFRHGQHLLPREGHADPQAAVKVPAAILVEGARHLLLESCEVGHVGIYGVWFRKGTSDCRIERSHLHDLGAGGVRIGEETIAADPALRTRGVVVHNNIIQSGGHRFPGAVGIWIGQSGDNQITHNDIGDFRYTGVSVGWTWGYGPSLARNNRIEFNRIHHLGWGVLSDLGGVYTLGISHGTRIAHNWIHDVYSYDRYGRGGWGLYNDEGSSGILLENNLVHDVKTGGYHQHYGRENMVRNNIFAYSMEGQLQRSRVEEHLSFTFERNLVLWQGGPLLHGHWEDGGVILSSNLYWEAGGGEVRFGSLPLARWQQQGKDRGSVVADPLFEDPGRRDFRLRPDSPAQKIGFEPFDWRQAGVYGTERWKQLARARTYPPVQFAPAPPPLELRESFETITPGSPPIGLHLFVEGRGDSVVVTEEQSADGKRSLKVVDAPGLKHRFNPHFYFSPGRRSGIARCAFQLRVEPATEFYHEWRDDQSPYRVGPSFSIAKGRLFAAGRDLMAIPAGAWVRFEVSAGLGPQSTGTWTLRVLVPGTAAREFAPLPCQPEWKHLEWLGFVSQADAVTAYFLDALELSGD